MAFAYRFFIVFLSRLKIKFLNYEMFETQDIVNARYRFLYCFSLYLCFLLC